MNGIRIESLQRVPLGVWLMEHDLTLAIKEQPTGVWGASLDPPAKQSGGQDAATVLGSSVWQAITEWCHYMPGQRIQMGETVFTIPPMNAPTQEEVVG